MIKIKIKDGDGSLKLPDDVGVPEALRPQREMTTEEKNNHFFDMAYFASLHIKRNAEAKKKGKRR